MAKRVSSSIFQCKTPRCFQPATNRRRHIVLPMPINEYRASKEDTTQKKTLPKKPNNIPLGVEESRTNKTVGHGLEYATCTHSSRNQRVLQSIAKKTCRNQSLKQEQGETYSSVADDFSSFATGSAFATNCSDALFIQYLRPVGCGPSSNTCPRCALHREQCTSVRG